MALSISYARSSASYDELEKLLQNATDALDGAARRVKDLGLNPTKNVRGIGEAIVLASRIRAQICAVRPDSTPRYMRKGMNAPLYELRPATVADFDFCFRLNERNMRPFVERLRVWGEATERAAFAGQFRAGRDAIVVVDGRDVGHLGVDDAGDGPVVLRMIALAPEVQRRGIGAAIVRDILHDAHRRGRAVMLRVTEENIAARRLYERLGFRAVDVIATPEARPGKVLMVATAPGGPTRAAP